MTRIWWIAWTLGSWISVLLCSSGAVLPFWIRGTLMNLQRPVAVSYLGLYRRCTYPEVFSTDGAILLRYECGHYQFLFIPHLYWQVTLVTLLLACAVGLFLALVLCFLGCCIDILAVQRVQRALQLGQLFAGLLATTACFMYPFGWSENAEVAQICGEMSGRFQLGRCEIGWAFVLSTCGGVFTLLSSLLPSVMNYRKQTHLTIAGPQHNTENSSSPIPYTAVLPRPRPQRLSMAEFSNGAFPAHQRYSTPMLLSTSPTSFLLSSVGHGSSADSHIGQVMLAPLHRGQPCSSQVLLPRPTSHCSMPPLMSTSPFPETPSERPAHPPSRSRTLTASPSSSGGHSGPLNL